MQVAQAILQTELAEADTKEYNHAPIIWKENKRERCRQVFQLVWSYLAALWG